MKQQSRGSLGTFVGVYTPTILTILGVIMYLRLGWVTGNLGLPGMLFVVLIANGITLITTLSFSSMATNMKVGAGGAYFIISRSLGLGVGAAIGVPLFLSQAVSVTLYSYGLAESLRLVWPEAPLAAVSLAVILGVAGVSFYGARFALRVQVPLLAIVGVSLAALAYGAVTGSRVDPVTVIQPQDPVDFWMGFAIFFPAVTGVMAGLSLSGDLKNPERSIPLGAIAATVTGFIVYLIIPIVLDRAATSDALTTDSLIWLKIAPLGIILVLPGLWGAILSSAMGSILGAPRTLQAVVNDQIGNQKVRAFVSGVWGERAALGLTTGIGLGFVLLGDLNAVAQVVTMFFLTVYGTINIVAGIESISGDPSWRPRFRIPSIVNIACGFACLWVMFLISPLASLAAITIEILLWLVFVRREQRATWGDSRRGLYEAILRWVLVRLSRRPMSARNWRPHILVFVDDPAEKLDLIRFGSWFSQDRGVVSVCELAVGDLLTEDIRRDDRMVAAVKLLKEEQLTVFPEIDVVDNVIDGIVDVAQANGIAGFSSNTVVLGWPTDGNRLAEFLIIARRLERLRKSVVIGKLSPRRVSPARKAARQIHIWWGGLKQNGDLMLLLAHLLTRSHEWRGAELKILSAASNEFARQNTSRHLEAMLREIRIDAECVVFPKPAEMSMSQVIQSRSNEADAVFLGLAIPDPGKEMEYVDRLIRLVGDLPAVFLVKNSSLFIGTLLTAEDLEPT